MTGFAPAPAGVRRVGAHGGAYGTLCGGVLCGGDLRDAPAPGGALPGGVRPGGVRPGGVRPDAPGPSDPPLQAACADPAVRLAPTARLAVVAAELTHTAALTDTTSLPHPAELPHAAELAHDAPPAPPDALHMATNEPSVLLPGFVRMVLVPVRMSHSRVQPMLWCPAEGRSGAVTLAVRTVSTAQVRAGGDRLRHVGGCPVPARAIARRGAL